MKQSIGQLALVVQDYEEAIAFYVDTLGAWAAEGVEAKIGPSVDSF